MQLKSLDTILSSILDSLTGEYHSQNPEIIRLKKNLLDNLEYKGFALDKLNMRNDFSLIYFDIQKAYKEYLKKKLWQKENEVHR